MRSLFLKISLVACFCFPLFSAAAHATPIFAGTYTLSGVTVNGSALTGTVTLGSDGLATAANLSYASADYGNPSFNMINSNGFSGNNPVANFAYIAGANGQVALYYMQTLNLTGGITLCEAGSNCAQASYLQVYYPDLNAGLVGGSLASSTAPASVSATPEPSSWILLLSGLLMVGAVIVLRRNDVGTGAKI